MFRDAFAIARQFTLPVVLSRKTIAGKCESTIGTCVVINDEGWIVTAAHILLMLDQLRGQEIVGTCRGPVCSVTTEALRNAARQMSASGINAAPHPRLELPPAASKSR